MTFVVIPREMFVHRVPSVGRRLTDRYRKIWLIVQWYFSGNDIADRIQVQVGV